ncbi:MAG: (2Fe-2S)-binding protein [Bacteroidetes bacterium QS_1_63_11]|nr:MAG: (2Fe-2S)-binding protein [Bacteroidetes bacterium QS_1_63_11]
MYELNIEGAGTCEVKEGTRLVRAIEDCGVNLGHRCGGQSNCTTCRVEFEDQIVVDRDMTVKPLMTVEDQGWGDAGPEPAITVEPAAEWHPIDRLEQQ